MHRDGERRDHSDFDYRWICNAHIRNNANNLLFRDSTPCNADYRFHWRFRPVCLPMAGKYG
jgi:hypothetical protein